MTLPIKFWHYQQLVVSENFRHHPTGGRSLSNLGWIAPNLEIADLAARIRALHHLWTPDALQAATAVHTLSTGLITNDPVFERVEGFETMVLDGLV